MSSVPIPKFANPCGTFACELRNQRGHCQLYDSSAPLNPKFAVGLPTLACELRVRGTSPVKKIAGRDDARRCGVRIDVKGSPRMRSGLALCMIMFFAGTGWADAG